MSQNSDEKTLEIIEVPAELRGLSDEEIIKNSEKPLREISGKRKNGAKRPSKRDRLAQKAAKQNDEAQIIANEIFGNAAKKERESENKAQELFSAKNSASNSNTIQPSNAEIPMGKPREIKSVLSEGLKPASGRVLKVSFGAKGLEKPKAIIVSAADLAKQKAEERAKKIAHFFKAKNSAATTAPDGTPIKRPRGRPRKNPLPPPEGI